MSTDPKSTCECKSWQNGMRFSVLVGHNFSCPHFAITAEKHIETLIKRTLKAESATPAPESPAPARLEIAEPKIPEGYRKIEAYTDFKTVVIMGDPYTLMQNEEEGGHNCDALGCGSFGHVLARLPILPASVDIGTGSETSPDAGASIREAVLKSQALLARWIVPDSDLDDRAVLSALLGILDHRDLLAALSVAKPAEQREAEQIPHPVAEAEQSPQPARPGLKVSIARYNPSTIRFENGPDLATVTLPDPEIAARVVEILTAAQPPADVIDDARNVYIEGYIAGWGDIVTQDVMVMAMKAWDSSESRTQVEALAQAPTRTAGKGE